MKITDYESLHYVIFFILLLLIIPYQNFSLAVSLSNTLNLCSSVRAVFSKMWSATPLEGNGTNWLGGRRDVRRKLNVRIDCNSQNVRLFNFMH
jgi:hypothetical protein